MVIYKYSGKREGEYANKRKEKAIKRAIYGKMRLYQHSASERAGRTNTRGGRGRRAELAGLDIASLRGADRARQRENRIAPAPAPTRTRTHESPCKPDSLQGLFLFHRAQAPPAHTRAGAHTRASRPAHTQALQRPHPRTPAGAHPPASTHAPTLARTPASAGQRDAHATHPPAHADQFAPAPARSKRAHAPAHARKVLRTRAGALRVRNRKILLGMG